MKNSENLRKGSNDGVVWMLPQVQAIKETSVAFNINKIIQGCFGMVGGFKMGNPAGTSIRCGSADNMVLNPTLFIFSDITRGGWNFQRENRILLYLNVFKIICMQEGHCREHAI